MKKNNYELIKDIQNAVNNDVNLYNILKNNINIYIDTIVKTFNNINDIRLHSLSQIIENFNIITEENYKMIYKGSERLGHLSINSNNKIEIVLTMENNKKISLDEFIKQYMTYSLKSLLYIIQLSALSIPKSELNNTNFDTVLQYFEQQGELK